MNSTNRSERSLKRKQVQRAHVTHQKLSAKKQTRMSKTEAATAARIANRQLERMEVNEPEQDEEPAAEQGNRLKRWHRSKLVESSTQSEIVQFKDCQDGLALIIGRIKEDFEKEICHLKEKLKKAHQEIQALLRRTRKSAQELKLRQKQDRAKEIALLIQPEGSPKPASKDRHGSRSSQLLGNHLRKLLTNEGPAKMTEVVAGSPFAPTLLQLFQMLGRMQGYARASFLSDADIVKFEQLAHEYYDLFRVNFTLHSITSKAHWLVVHIPEFMKRWKFWGLMSEQPIEAMHHQVNKDSDRFASMRDPKKIIMKIFQQSSLRNALFDNEISTDLIPDEEDVRMTLQQIE